MNWQLLQPPPLSYYLYIVPGLVEITRLVSQVSKPSRDLVKQIDKKLENCRNQDLNPNSALWVEIMFKGDNY